MRIDTDTSVFILDNSNANGSNGGGGEKRMMVKRLFGFGRSIW